MEERLGSSRRGNQGLLLVLGAEEAVWSWWMVRAAGTTTAAGFVALAQFHSWGCSLTCPAGLPLPLLEWASGAAPWSECRVTGEKTECRKEKGRGGSGVWRGQEEDSANAVACSRREEETGVWFPVPPKVNVSVVLYVVMHLGLLSLPFPGIGD